MSPRWLILAIASRSSAFSLGHPLGKPPQSSRSAVMNGAATPCIDPRDAPGDPSLILTTNVALEDKAGFVSACSAAVAAALSKPESYVAICVTDGHEGMSFGGSTDPCAVGCVYSIGQINQENNAVLCAIFCSPSPSHQMQTRLPQSFADQFSLAGQLLCLTSSRSTAGWPTIEFISTSLTCRAPIGSCSGRSL